MPRLVWSWFKATDRMGQKRAALCDTKLGAGPRCALTGHQELAIVALRTVSPFMNANGQKAVNRQDYLEANSCAFYEYKLAADFYFILGTRQFYHQNATAGGLVDQFPAADVAMQLIPSRYLLS